MQVYSHAQLSAMANATISPFLIEQARARIAERNSEHSHKPRSPEPQGLLLRSLAPGDVLLVTKLDRLARSTRDLLNTLAAIDEASAGFRSLGDPWADSTSAQIQQFRKGT